MVPGYRRASARKESIPGYPVAFHQHAPPQAHVPILLRKNLAGTAESAGYAVTGHEGSSTGTIVTAYSGGDLSKLNEDNHQVTASSKRRQFKENYDYFINKIYSMGTSPQSDYTQAQRDDLQKPSQSPINTGRKAYYANGNATIQSAWSVANTDSMVIFVNGSLTIKNTITIAPGGFVALIVKGDITIDPSVGTADYASTTPQVEGLYIADGIFTVDSRSWYYQNARQKFVGRNICWLERCEFGARLSRHGITRSGNKNNTVPSEVFVARPICCWPLHQRSCARCTIGRRWLHENFQNLRQFGGNMFKNKVVLIGGVLVLLAGIALLLFNCRRTTYLLQ